MSNTRPLTFDAWCSRLLPTPNVATINRTPFSSTTVTHRPVPASVRYWAEFPTYVGEWKAEMHARGLGGSRFEAFAKEATRIFTTGDFFPELIRAEEETRQSLRQFFQMVNNFNLDFYQFLHPGAPYPNRETEVYAYPLASLGVDSNPDAVITNGQPTMTKVGLGEVKPPWVVIFDPHVRNFMGDLPFHNFGQHFIATPNVPEVVMVGRALTQIYSDLLSDRVCVGFLATSDHILYCLVPPEDRTSLFVFGQRIWRRERAQYFSPTLNFTAQVGLATLAWLARTRYNAPQPAIPFGSMKVWDDFSKHRKRLEEQQDPTYNPTSSRAARPSHLRQNPPSSGGYRGYQYCTSACLVALKKNTTYRGCPNYSDHPSDPYVDVEIVIDQVKECLRHVDMEGLGGGNHSKTVAVRTPTGYTLAVKVFNEKADPAPFLNELEIYHHLEKLQGCCVPVVVGSGESVYAGTMRHIIIMSYEGVSAMNCDLTETILERIASAFSAIHCNSVFHQDLSLANVLINDDKISVIDFESAAICDRDAPVLEEEQEIVEKACDRVKVSGDKRYFMRDF